MAALRHRPPGVQECWCARARLGGGTNVILSTAEVSSPDVWQAVLHSLPDERQCLLPLSWRHRIQLVGHNEQQAALGDHVCGSWGAGDVFCEFAAASPALPQPRFFRKTEGSQDHSTQSSPEARVTSRWVSPSRSSRARCASTSRATTCTNCRREEGRQVRGTVRSTPFIGCSKYGGGSVAGFQPYVLPAETANSSYLHHRLGFCHRLLSHCAACMQGSQRSSDGVLMPVPGCCLQAVTAARHKPGFHPCHHCFKAAKLQRASSPTRQQAHLTMRWSHSTSRHSEAKRQQYSRNSAAAPDSS